MKRQATPHIKTVIGQNLRAARDAKRFTQRELAQAVDTDAFQISRWEMGRVRPSDSMLVLLAEALDVDYIWFFTPRELAA